MQYSVDAKRFKMKVSVDSLKRFMFYSSVLQRHHLGREALP